MRIKEIDCRRPPYAFQFRLLPSIGEIISKRESLSVEVHTWCQEQFGDPDTTYKSKRWHTNFADFYFMNPDDAFAFKMRWL